MKQLFLDIIASFLIAALFVGAVASLVQHDWLYMVLFVAGLILLKTQSKRYLDYTKKERIRSSRKRLKEIYEKFYNAPDGGEDN